jgi:hypothetical protein
MAIVFLMNKEIALGMVCFFHQKKALLLNFVFFKKVPKVNCRPIGEHSPNLVTLDRGSLQKRKSGFGYKNMHN